MKTLTPTMVYNPQPAGIPQDLIIWQDENSGTRAIIEAARAMVNGQTVRFALCDHEPYQAPIIREIVTLAMDPTDNTPRYCGERNLTNTSNSHDLIPSWYEYAADPAYIAVALVQSFKNYKRFFRLANI